MRNFIFMGVLLALFAIGTPLIADPGGGVAQSNVIFSNALPSVNTLAGVFGAVIGATNPAAAESFKSIIYPIAGGVVALLGAILLAMIVAPFLSHLPLSSRRRGRQFETNAFGLRLKRTKSPVLKMRATA